MKHLFEGPTLAVMFLAGADAVDGCLHGASRNDFVENDVVSAHFRVRAGNVHHHGA